MKKFDLPLWSDTLFCFAGLGLFFTCLFRFLRVSLFLSVLFALLLSATASLLFFRFSYRNRQKKFLLGQEKEEKEKLMFHLALLNDEVTNNLLHPIAEGKKCFFLFTVQPLSADAVALKIKENADCDFEIWCNELTDEAKKLCREFSIAVLDGNAVYTLLRDKNALPEKYIGEDKKKVSRWERLRSVFKKSNAPSFFSCGVTLLALSLFTFYPLYYLVTGSILLMTALLLRLFAH